MKIAFDSFTLPNGLTTIVHTDRSTPSVYVGLWYRTGSKDEPEGKTGFAHLFEHMMFQQTANRTGDYVSPLTDAGATDINGETTADRTLYHQTVPTGSLDLALWMESDRMGHLVGGITQASLDEQRGVVKNEKLQSASQPGTVTDDVMTPGYYPPGHPYAHTVIGSMADLDRASVDDVKRWFIDYYGASNAVLVLSGDIDIETAREKVTRYFGAVPPGRRAPQVMQWVPGFAAIRRDEAYAGVPAASIIRRWPLATDDARSNTLLQLAARTLAGSPNSFLNRRLVTQLRVATNVTAMVSDDLLDNSFNLNLVVAPGVTVAAAGKALDAALADYYAVGPDPQRLAAIVAATDMALLRSSESNAAIGQWLLDGYVRHDDPLFFLKQRAWIERPDAAQLKALAQSRLDRPWYELVLLPEPALRAGTADVDRTRLPVPAPIGDAIAFPPIAQTTLSNGMKLVVAGRRSLPLVDLSLQFATGSRADGGYAPGAAAAAFAGMAAAARDRDASSGRISERIGFGPSVTPGERRSGVIWSATTAHLDQSMALAATMIRRPQQVEPARAGNGRGEAQSRDPMAAAGAIYTTALWGKGHPNAGIVAPDTVRPVAPAVAARFRGREIGPNNATLYMIGDVTLDEARVLAERHFGDWARIDPSPLPDLPPPTGVAGRVVLVDAPGAPQSSVSVGQFVGPAMSETAAAEALMSAALAGGLESRLNTNLREGKGWTYGIQGGIADTPAGARLLTIGGLVQADRTAASMAEIRREIADFATVRPITAAELERTRVAAIRGIQAGFGSNAAYLSAMIAAADYGQAPDRAAGAAKRLSAVGVDDVRQLAARTYRPAGLTWVVVGDLATIEQDVRALGLGPVEVWSVDGHRLR